MFDALSHISDPLCGHRCRLRIPTSRDGAGCRSAIRLSLLGLLLLLSLVEISRAESPRPNIILITVDTFRPDHLGYYGYPKNTSPNLDAISQEGVFFRQAFTTSGWTTPGLISILTSLYAPTHAVDIRGRSLAPEVVTLPERLVEAGYQAPDIFFLTDIPNFANLGLQPYERREELIDRGDEILFQWLEEEVDGDRPFFLYYHYRELHLPYKAGEPYESMFLPDAFASPLGFISSFKRFLAAEKIAVVKGNVMITRGLMDFGPRDRPWVRALYDAQIRRLDDLLFARLRRVLEAEGLDRNTLVIISADHGEELLDRDLIGHVSTFKEGRLYDEITRIPLIFWFPGVLPSGEVIDEPVQCIDVMPTVLDLVGVPPPEGMQGRSLLPLIEGDGAWRNRPLFFETSGAGYTADEAQYKQRFRAVRTERWKLHYASPEDRYTLFDLADDPGEREDVAGDFPQVADSLKGLLNEWVVSAQERSYLQERADADSDATAPEAAFAPGERVEVLFPSDGDTLQYQGDDHVIQLKWTGPEKGTYQVEYEIGEGAYHLEGVLTVNGSSPRYGPFQAYMWDSLVLYNPWKFRLYPQGHPEEKSGWVTFYLASVGGKETPRFSFWSALVLVRQGLGEAFTHGRNLLWGIGRGTVDLWLLAATVPAADLSAYGLLLVIAGAIAWPYLQRIGRARCRAWGLALLYILFVYSTIPVMPQVWKALREYTDGSIRYLGILLVVAVAGYIGVRLWRQREGRGWGTYLALLIIGPIYAYLLNKYAVFPSERLHLIEYGFVGGVLFNALRLDMSRGKAYIGAFLGTILIGIGDECIQWILPQRFFEVKDIQLNAISGGLGLLLLRFVIRLQGDVDEGQEAITPEREPPNA